MATSIKVNGAGSKKYQFPNGMKWEQSNITSGTFYSVYSANGLWVTGSNGNGLYYSTDGKTWTQSNITSGIFQSVYNANGIWVAGGQEKRKTGAGTSENSSMYYSTDGRTWSKSSSSAAKARYIHGVFYMDGLWIAVYTAQYALNMVYSGGILYSTDGRTWTTGLTISSVGIYSVYNANGVWVAGSSPTLTKDTSSSYGYKSSAGVGLYYSTDGKTWTQSNITSGTFYTVYNANGIWVAGGSSGLYYSTDGKSWTQSNITSDKFEGLYNANGLWVAGGNSGGLYYSTDGKTWTQSNVTSRYICFVYNANGLWVAGCANNFGLYYSTDGKSWAQSNASIGAFYSAYNANGLWVACGVAGSSPYSLPYSPTWEPTIPAGDYMFSAETALTDTPIGENLPFTSANTTYSKMSITS